MMQQEEQIVNGPQSVFVQFFSESSLSDAGAFFELHGFFSDNSSFFALQDFTSISFFSEISAFFALQETAFEQKPSLPQLFSLAKKVLKINTGCIVMISVNTPNMKVSTLN